MNRLHPVQLEVIKQVPLYQQVPILTEDELTYWIRTHNYETSFKKIQAVIEDTIIWYGAAIKKEFGPRVLFNKPLVHYLDTGNVAGAALPGSWELVFNPITLLFEPVEFLEKTLPHEVAHLLAVNNNNETGHGVHWKSWCHALGHTEPEQFHRLPETKKMMRILEDRQIEKENEE